MKNITEQGAAYWAAKEQAELHARFAAIRAFYSRFGAALLLESNEWGIDPYEWERCPAIRMTPIESALWHDIRGVDIVMYPQYPVGRFFVDFGNPAARVAIECDGQQWHTDKQKDADRDAELKALGWAVYRITGRECLTDTEDLRDGESGCLRVELGVARKFIQSIADRHAIGRNRRDVDLDQIKARGLNSLEKSARMLAARQRLELDDIEMHFARVNLDA